MIGLKAEPVLRDLGMRGDIIKTMHRAFHRDLARRLRAASEASRRSVARRSRRGTMLGPLATDEAIRPEMLAPAHVLGAAAISLHKLARRHRVLGRD
jgi:hypothetical protein